MSTLSRYLFLLVLLVLSACGGGGGSGGAPAPTVPPAPPVAPPTPVPPVQLTTITVQSDAGDSIGLGKNYSYSRSTANIEVTAEKNRLVVRVTGDEWWTGVFQTGGAEQSQLKVGMVASAARYEDDGDWSRSSHAWSGEGRYCTSSSGWFAIDSVSYSGPRVTQITLRFERHCNGAAAALRGEIRYYADDASKAPPPVMPIPATLWRPPADFGASVGNSAYFESEAGDFVGLGKNYAYDQRNAAVTVSGTALDLVIQVKGNERWTAELRSRSDYSTTIEPGYYPGIHGSRFNNPVKGGLSWTGEGRGCRVSHGWYAVDAITMIDGQIASLDMRFEQHCEGRTAALHGAIHWSDPSRVVFPRLPGNTAVGSWSAPAAQLPASGNYFYVQTDPGQPLGKGLVDLQTGTNATISASAGDNTLSFETHGVHNWHGEFIAKLGQGQFVAGNYPNLEGHPFPAPSSAAMAVFGDGTAPTLPKGWLVIDSIRYVEGKLVAVDLRFEQIGSDRIGNDKGLLHGQLHWRADQPIAFPGPAPAPALFWRPAPGVTPSAGNYLYMESDRSDFVGWQGTYLFTPLDSLFSLTSDGLGVRLDVRGDQLWSGNFIAMSGLKQIQAGYYGGQENSEYYNPIRGMFSFGGDGRGCNTATSGVVVDKATYEGTRLVELHMRFEQHCENEPGALRGEIRWSASDVRVPQGPAAIPATLWRAPAGALPAAGTYLYVHSEAGAAMGNGKVGLMTAQDSKIFGDTSAQLSPEAYFGLNVESPTLGRWRAELQAMVGLKQFQVGFYNWTMRFPFQNRAFGGLSWIVNSSGCNSSIGWFAIDKATYVGDTLTAIHARFEHYCETETLASHGEFNWEATPAAIMAARMQPQSAAPGKVGKSTLLEGPGRASRDAIK